MKKVGIKVDTASILGHIGRVYRSMCEAIKEYVSNAIDSYVANKGSVDVCHVSFYLTGGSITIATNAPGMTEGEFKEVLQRVASSMKQDLGIAQIGSMGIGMWAFGQFARRAEFLSKKRRNQRTIKVVLKDGRDYAEFTSATKKEELEKPGMVVRITGLKTNPTQSSSPLAALKLVRYLSEKFDAYLRKEALVITVEVTKSGKTRHYEVEPMDVVLPRVAETYTKQYADGDSTKEIELTLWFDASQHGKVSIRHMGLPIIDNMAQVDCHGLEEGIFGSGYLTGYIDANFLHPLPARGAFEADGAWQACLKVLSRIQPSLQGEVDILLSDVQQEEVARVHERALALAKELFSGKGLDSLEWLRGGAKKRGLVTKQGTHPSRGRIGARKDRSDTYDPLGFKISLQELPFESPVLHSRFIKGGVIQVNTLNPDYQEAIRATEKAQVSYFASMIGKEVIGYNDKTGFSDESLERQLTFFFGMQRKI